MPFNRSNTAKTITYAMSPYRVSPNDDMLDVDTSGGAVSIVIPAMKEYVKHWFVIQLTPSAANAATVTLDNGGNINGASSYALTALNQRALLMSRPDGTYLAIDAGFLAVVTALTSGQIIVGSSTGVPTARTLTGDVTNTNAGVTAIGAGKVTGAMLKPAKGYFTVAVATNGTTPVNVFGSGGAPCALTVTSVLSIAKDTTAGNIILKQAANTVATIAKGTVAGVPVGAATVANATYAAADVCTVESSSGGNSFVQITFEVS
jgi:hypothetical protein